MKELNSEYFCEKAKAVLCMTSNESKFSELVTIDISLINVESFDPWFEPNSYESGLLKEFKVLLSNQRSLSEPDMNRLMTLLVYLYEICLKIRTVERIAKQLKQEPTALWNKVGYYS